jgi:hypothetical protein
MPADLNQDEPILAELGQAGTEVDRVIQAMLGQGLSAVAIASALLGGSLCLLSKTMGDEAVLQLLQNAAAGVRAGDLRQ